jgi:hypothetical protein
MSQHSDAVPGLNENRLRRVYATCLHLDRLLTAIVDEFSGHLSALRWILEQDRGTARANEAHDGGE